MNYKTDTTKEKFTLKNPQKYYGNKAPISKSSWEFKIFDFMDRCNNVLKWGYECFQVPYYNPIKKAQSVYFPDIYCIVQQADGTQKQFLLEIKPYKMSVEPSIPKRPKSGDPNAIKRYEKAIRNYQINKANFEVNKSKWAQARAWCTRHNISFFIITEKDYTFMIEKY